MKTHKWSGSILGTNIEVGFENFTISQFMFSESNILNRNSISKKQRDTRLDVMQRHYERILKLEKKFSFNKTKEPYHEVICSIEKNEIDWCNITIIAKTENEAKFDSMKVVV